MAWKYRSPTAFPARYPQALRLASAQPSIPQLIWAGTPSEIFSESKRFLHYRWCIRQRPDACPDLAQILSLYNLRTSSDGLGLFVTATESHISQLELLNPHLAGILEAESQ